MKNTYYIYFCDFRGNNVYQTAPTYKKALEIVELERWDSSYGFQIVHNGRVIWEEPEE